MPKLGKYCKAYMVKDFRGFSGWTENSANARQEKRNIEGAETMAPREITDDDFLYLQENYIVTDGIFLDENIIFDAVTPEWTEFCKSTLAFEVPVYESASNKEEQARTASPAAQS